MENNTDQIQPQAQAQDRAVQKTDRQLLEEIHENSRKTKNYMKWQLIITVALVVIPLLATVIIIPFVMRSFASMYSTAGLGLDAATQIQDLLK